MRILVASIVASLTVLAARPADAQRIAIGVRGGLNRATADAKGSLFEGDPGSTTQWHAGAVATVEISRFLALQTQFLLSRKGFAEGTGNVGVDVGYVEIPVLAMIQIPGRVSPHLYAGPVLALENSCTVTTASGGEEQCGQALEGPATKGADSGIVLGGGVKLDAGPGYFLFDVLYNYGLTNVAEFREDVDSIKLRTIYVSVGYLFRLGDEYR